MTESRSASKSHNYYNLLPIPRKVEDLFENNITVDMTNYKQLYTIIENWLKSNPGSMDEKTCQLSFYMNCMKVYNKSIGDKLKHCDNFQGTIFKNLFQRLIPDFCLVDYYNSKLKSEESDLDLEFLPLHIVSIVEIKKKMKDEDIGQLLHYLQVVLDYSPSCRRFIIGIMTDFRDIRFGKVSRSNNDYDFIYEASKCAFKNEEEYLLDYLTKFFTIDPSQFGFKRLEQLPKNILIHNKLLGIGANSMVFNCLINHDNRNEYTLKISNKPVDKEIFIYKKLYGNKYNIIKVCEYVFLFRHLPGEFISKDILLNNIHIIWEQIKHAHRNNIIHRDIRKSNIVQLWNHQHASSEILLIDWQSSAEIGFSGEYNGTLSTASKFIINELTYKRHGNIKCLPIDDCISLMKMILLEIIPEEKYKNEISLEVKNGSYAGINFMYDQINDNYAMKQPILLKVIRFLETEAHRSTLKDDILHFYIDQCVKKSYCLCQWENQQLDIDYFDQLEKDLFSS
ncbi:unnamed protein product [Rotaria sordida]|uniref:Protein kinase domain-containing protein n=1 Tax=Rotaria sordida TaxID=392033 RepID=A0A815I6A4_9BILA|nr:unnamed protein product [Rotaria sordida]CAF4039104.1 unnamed protein product [Rotaria sordida]